MHAPKKKKSIITLSLCIGLSLGCVSSHGRSPDAVREEKSTVERLDNQVLLTSAAEKMGAHDVTEIDFKPGSAELTSAAKATLRSLLIQAQGMGTIADILVVSWADNEYPTRQISKLSKEQRKLAEDRNKSVRNYLQTLVQADIETYSMAERPKGLARWFNTKDTRLKNSLVAAGIPTTADNPQYPSKSSQSVILVKVK